MARFFIIKISVAAGGDNFTEYRPGGFEDGSAAIGHLQPWGVPCLSLRMILKGGARPRDQ